MFLALVISAQVRACRLNGGAKIDGRPASKRLLDFTDHREQVDRVALAQIKDIER